MVQPNRAPESTRSRATITCPECGRGAVPLGGACDQCGYRSSLGYTRKPRSTTSRPGTSTSTYRRQDAHPCPRCGKTLLHQGGRCASCGYIDGSTASGPTYRHSPHVAYAEPPAITTTVLITLFFGLFGLIPATMHTNQAMTMGKPTNKYWKAFGVSLAVEIAFWVLVYVIIIAVAANAISSYSY